MYDSADFISASKRVRDAKQNGLWRSTSWGGGFQQYIGEYDGDNRKPKKRDKPPGHVQWNLQANIELVEPKNVTTFAETSKQLKAKNDIQNGTLKNFRATEINECNVRNYADNKPRKNLSLTLLDKEKVEKQFMKVVPVQSVKPIITNITAFNTTTTAAKAMTITTTAASTAGTVTRATTVTTATTNNKKKKNESSRCENITLFCSDMERGCGNSEKK
uniref:Uncharacterized protein n=1 Tax=Setaria digitata TaxID=48799 RepID=A0A915Q2U4_9BILA